MLETFFNEYSRLSFDNSMYIFKASIQAIYFIAKGKREFFKIGKQ